MESLSILKDTQGAMDVAKKKHVEGRREIRVALELFCEAYNQEFPEHHMEIHKIEGNTESVTIFDKGALRRAQMARIARGPDSQE